MRNLKDTIYEDDDFIIIKKDVDAIGHFEPSTYLGLIHLAIKPLQEWENFGLKEKSDAQSIIENINIELLECLSK